MGLINAGIQSLFLAQKAQKAALEEEEKEGEEGNGSGDDGAPAQPEKFLPCRYAPEVELKELEVPEWYDSNDNGDYLDYC